MALYGRHGAIHALPGKRDELLAVLRDASRAAPSMPGCRLYLVGASMSDPDTVLVTEVWDDRASHAASLSLPSVRALITQGRPLIARMDAASEFEVADGLV